MISSYLEYQAQTSPYPMGLEVCSAKGSYIYTTDGKSYLDFVAGVSACALGHCHPSVVEAIKTQLDKYMHVMVYGEFIHEPCVAFCKLLSKNLPKPLQSTYLVNSGTEAIEGALKLAKRATGRSHIISAHYAYHGNTQGSMSVMGMEQQKGPFRPLIPGVEFVTFNSFLELSKITTQTAAVILETIQGSAGFIAPEEGYLSAVKKRCEDQGALLILDEIQPGFGRTGKLFAFEHYQVVPDVLVVGKGMGGGMPVGAFVASKSLMAILAENPKLGHITTFGGNPVIASAALATLNTLLSSSIIQDTIKKELLIRSRLKHPLIREIRGKGLMISLIMKNDVVANYTILESLKRGLILFWLLFEPKAVRISPPLTISESEIIAGCEIIINVLNTYENS